MAIREAGRLLSSRPRLAKDRQLSVYIWRESSSFNPGEQLTQSTVSRVDDQQASEHIIQEKRQSRRRKGPTQTRQGPGRPGRARNDSTGHCRLPYARSACRPIRTSGNENAQGRRGARPDLGHFERQGSGGAPSELDRGGHPAKTSISRPIQPMAAAYLLSFCVSVRLLSQVSVAVVSPSIWFMWVMSDRRCQSVLFSSCSSKFQLPSSPLPSQAS